MKAMYCEQLGELILDDRIVPVPEPIRNLDASLEEKLNLVRVWGQATHLLPFGVTLVTLESHSAPAAAI